MNSHNNMTDEQLIQFYLVGDSNTLATLVELYKDRIYQSIYRIVQDKYVAEEIFDEVFIRIINNLMAGKTADHGHFLKWAMQIAYNLCVEHTRKANHVIVENQTTSKKTEKNLSLPAAGDITSYHESHGKLKSMIDLLPEAQREVIMLNHYGGLSFVEIANTMKCSLNNALDTMRFGLNNLRKMMTEKEMAV